VFAGRSPLEAAKRKAFPAAEWRSAPYNGSPRSCRAREIPIPFILSHQVLDEILQSHKIKSNDLARIDALFGGADGYYWYHTLKHMCPKKDVIVWRTEQAMREAVQNQENETAAEDEVKPQVLTDAHVAAMARLLAVRG